MNGHGEIRLSELYQEVILDHNRNPRNWGRIEKADRYAHGVNPLCGDDYELFVKLAPDRTLAEIKFEGHGCAISKASASLMTAAVEKKSAREAEVLKDHFIRLLTGAAPSDADRAGVGKLKFFEGVKNFPIRVKCATLAWRALEAALQGDRQNQVTTEE